MSQQGPGYRYTSPTNSETLTIYHRASSPAPRSPWTRAEQKSRTSSPPPMTGTFCLRRGGREDDGEKEDRTGRMGNHHRVNRQSRQDTMAVGAGQKTGYARNAIGTTTERGRTTYLRLRRGPRRRDTLSGFYTKRSVSWPSIDRDPVLPFRPGTKCDATRARKAKNEKTRLVNEARDIFLPVIKTSGGEFGTARHYS